MNNWLKIGVPLLIAVLLITATVGITLAITARGAEGQAAAYTPGQETVNQYARGPQCSNCAGNGQGAVTGDQDDSAGSVYVPKGATCPNCPGYSQGTTAVPGTQGAGTTTRTGGCCRGR
jgi:hypothetical protein